MSPIGGFAAASVSSVDCAAGWLGGAACGAGSLTGGKLTDVSPVNGFLYSLCGVITSSAVGLYAPGVVPAAGPGVLGNGRRPRARPDPRVEPNAPALGAVSTGGDVGCGGTAAAGWVGTAAAGWSDVVSGCGAAGGVGLGVSAAARLSPLAGAEAGGVAGKSV